VDNALTATPLFAHAAAREEGAEGESSSEYESDVRL
jgi:hypothetical protein